MSLLERQDLLERREQRDQEVQEAIQEQLEYKDLEVLREK